VTLEKKLYTLVYILSGIVLLVVASMRRIHIESNIDFHFLPPLYSLFNVLTAVILMIGYVQIRKKNKENHQRYMTMAMIMSLIFLILYVTYHITTPETLYCGKGFLRIIYFLLLISHIVLAAVSFPLILITYVRGYLDKTTEHRRLARWVFPIWLYVCITGPICYLMLRPCYNFAL